MKKNIVLKSANSVRMKPKSLVQARDRPDLFFWPDTEYSEKFCRPDFRFSTYSMQEGAAESEERPAGVGDEEVEPSGTGWTHQRNQTARRL